MNFTSPTKVLETIRAGDTVNWRRGLNRAQITQSANGAPPLAEEVAKKMQIEINVNFMELAELLSHARRQYYLNFLSTEHFFRIKIPDAPERVRADYERIITDEINKPIKKSRSFFHLHQYRWTDVVTHGVGAALWENDEDWLPRFIAREDLRMPTDTETDFKSLDWFAVRHLYTVGELICKVWGRKHEPAPGWNKKSIKEILRTYKNINYDSPWSYLDWETQAERMAELVKQNLGYYESDAVPKIPLYSFYFKDTNRKWYLVVVPDSPSIQGVSGEPQEFLYQTDDYHAEDLSRLLHCQFGDLSFKTPFMLESVRSLGFELLEPTYWSNLTRCRLLQHVHENFNKWVQFTDPVDKSRPPSVDLSGPTTRVPPGLHILGPNERHQINPDLVEMAQSQLRQIMSEASSTYTQAADTGTQKEQTAFETGVKVQQVNAMLSGLMLVATSLEQPFDTEICRRFCLRKTEDLDPMEFQRRVIQHHGIPRKWVNVDAWEVEVESPLGSGNPTMAWAEAKQVLELRPLANPSAQNQMLHSAFTTFFGSKRAAAWAPTVVDRVSVAEEKAQNDFASLMWGIPVKIRPELTPIDQVDTLLRSLAGMITRIKQTAGVPSPGELAGLNSVAQHIALLIRNLSANPQEKARVRVYGQSLSRLANEIKGFQQRLMAAMQRGARQNGDGGQAAALTKSRATMMDSITKNRIATQESRQKMALANAEFAGDERRQNVKAANEIVRSRMKSMGQ